MNRLTKFSSAGFGMVLLAGLAIYQGSPGLATGEEDSLVGTAVIEVPKTEENDGISVSAETPDTECDPTKTLEDPDFEDCDKLSQK